MAGNVNQVKTVLEAVKAGIGWPRVPR